MPKPYLIQAQNSNLWCIVYSDRQISDLVNLTRAKDALAHLEAEYERSRKVKS